MQGLRDLFERIKTTWNNMTQGKKIALISLGAAFIISLTLYYFVFGKTTYVPLFTDLNDTDSGKIVQKLDELGTDYRLEMGGSTVSVPGNIVDKLRISLANEGALPSNGVGFELFDKSSFTLTSEDRDIMYQRALQGELQRSIMALEEVEFATVILSMPKESLFASEKEAGSASILLRLNAFQELSPQKVKGIIALVSGAVKGIPEENVQVIDTELNYLSFGIGQEADFTSIQETGNRLSMKQKFENTLAEEIRKLLEGALGRGRVLVKVNADMNFDSEESTSIVYNEENPVIRSIQEKILLEENEWVDLSLSPVDNNIQYYGETTDNIADTPGLESYENIRNYEIDETTVHTIKAPGVINRISTSVIYDGELSAPKKEAIRNIVTAAVGYDGLRGDIINVEGLAFDRTSEIELKKTMEEAEAAYQEELQKQTLMKYIGLGAGLVILLILFIIAMIRKGLAARKEKASQQVDLPEAELAATVQPMSVEEMIQDVAVRLTDTQENEREQEIKEYAQESPDKVAEIVKTWILKDEV